MRYMLMSNVDTSALAAMSPDAHQATMERFVSFTQALAESGVLCGAERLQPVDTATTVRVRDEQTLLTDGPYADLTESFGGFWIVQAPDLDTVLAYAADCPAAAYGSVEVRPLVELG
ncbi:YciI family protein [Streptosporangium sp. NPDC051023]|uniref:YciI family protein n=1 Tax=Streptosporangium sp. NPDC051023 TaxID=3155410 RepID=UPI00344EF9C8